MALQYQITVKGYLDVSWSAWFDGLTITHDADGNTRLAGAIRDQTALYGLIDKARDLALTLVAVVELTSITHNGLDPPPSRATAKQDAPAHDGHHPAAGSLAEPQSEEHVQCLPNYTKDRLYNE